MGEREGPLGPLLSRQGVVILDGGMGTELQARGVPLDPRLWSAGVVLDDPGKVEDVHRAYFEAGADVAISASYQASLEGYMTTVEARGSGEARGGAPPPTLLPSFSSRRGYFGWMWQRGKTREEAEALLLRAVALACDARDRFWADYTRQERGRDQRDEMESKAERGWSGGRCRPVVAASVGCFGATQADGSEYTGKYPQGMDTVEGLMEWHRPRLRILAKAGGDLLALETLPCQEEVEALVRLVTSPEEGLGHLQCWLTMACKDGHTLNSGHKLEDCLHLIESLDCQQPFRVVAVGVNCTPPQHIEEAVGVIRSIASPSREVVVYPNSGEVYVAQGSGWLPGSGSGQDEFASLGVRWREKGARLIGGCCRTNPETIRSLRKALVPSP